LQTEYNVLKSLCQSYKAQLMAYQNNEIIYITALCITGAFAIIFAACNFIPR
jgi:hypothetical protein